MIDKMIDKIDNGDKSGVNDKSRLTRFDGAYTTQTVYPTEG